MCFSLFRFAVVLFAQYTYTKTMLSRISFNPAWLVDLPAYQSASSRLVRKAAEMVFAAWERAGRLPVTWIGFDAISPDDMEVLCAGWKRDSAGYWMHPQMREELTSFMAAHGTRLHEMQAEVLAMAGEHSLLLSDAAHIKTHVKRTLPKDFCLTAKMRQWLREHGIEDDDKQNVVFEEFVTFAQKTSSRYVDWEAAFRNNVLMQIKRGAKGYGFVARPSKVEQVVKHNSDVIAMAGLRLRRKTQEAQARSGDRSGDLFGEVVV